MLRGGAADPRIKDVAGNALASDVAWTFTTAAPVNCNASPVAAENCLQGNPSSEWDVPGAGDSSIQGFATSISVNRGETVYFKVRTSASSYRFDIYRLGFYGGSGARRVATVQPSASLPQAQPNCLTDSTTGLVDCGNWAISGSWTVPANALETPFARTQLPGRFERRGRWLFDVAHNPDGIRTLAAALAAEPPRRPLHAVVSILRDKDWRAMLALLTPVVDRLWVTRAPSAPPDRAWDLEVGARELTGQVTGEHDFERALAAAEPGAGTVLVCGSFHTVGDAMARLPGFAGLG